MVKKTMKNLILWVTPVLLLLSGDPTNKKGMIFSKMFWCSEKNVSLQEIIEADAPEIQYTGRIDRTNPKAPVFSAPGVYIRFNFRGTDCDIVMSSENRMNYIAIVIDDLPLKRVLIEKERKTYHIADSLPDTEHSVLICKETESGVGSVTFHGLICKAILPPEQPERKIECYGNSITCGAKMLYGTPCDLTNNGTNWNAANSAYLSYGAITARSLNARWQLTSVSGIGLVHSCCGMNYTMKDAWDRIFLTDPSSPKWDFETYTPDVVTICLGQNDGSATVASEEFKNAYVSFIHKIREKYPHASIFCLTSPMADSTGSETCLFNVMKKSLSEIVGSVNASGDKNVYRVILPHDQNNGCPGQGHPGEEEHRQTATVLQAEIKARMGW